MKNKPITIHPDINIMPMWEPKSTMRFIVTLHTIKKDLVVPKYCIKKITRPSFSTYNSKKQWEPIILEFYEPLKVPILFQLLNVKLFTITVEELGPVGDICETWVLPDCKFLSVKASPLNWSETTNMSPVVTAEVDWREIYIKNGDSEIVITK